MSEVKVNKISPRTACGTVTLGDSGDTFTVPSGATITNAGTATGFGATGAVNWVTTPVTSTPTTGVSGSGYFVNSTGAIKTINLPASPSAGDIMAVVDYAGTAATYAITIGRNGSNINGSAADLVINLANSGVCLVYVDGTQGWKGTETNSTGDTTAPPTWIVGTGGTPCTGAIVCTDYKQHTFTGPGTFTVCSIGCTPGCNVVDYLVVAGGGGGGGDGPGGNPSDGGGGGGAGGYRESPGTATGCYTVSPLGAAPAVALPVTATGYPITVGAGGNGTTSPAVGTDGADSVFSTITSAGGGVGGSRSVTLPGRPIGSGNPGGSGGGAGGDGPDACGGAGNDPSTTPAQGKPGGQAGPSHGTCPAYASAGGGGATACGVTAVPCSAGPGGAGATSSINGTPTARAGGGGGGAQPPAPQRGSGGPGGGGTGGSNPSLAATAGTINTGGGGGGGDANDGAGGGSGVVIIRYKFQ